MLATNEPRYSTNQEVVRYVSDINGRPVIIDVPQELIEDRLASDRMEAGALEEFVRNNRLRIDHEVSQYLHHAPDVTGIRVGEEHLKHCK